MKKRICDISPYKNYIGQNSDLFTRYRPAFDLILQLNDGKKGSEKRDIFYIPDEDVDCRLKEIIADRFDTLSILIGYGGIGKSTSLQHFFEFTNSTPTMFQNAKILIFPSIFNGYVVGPDENGDMEDERLAKRVKDELTLRINSVCSFLEKRHPELRELFNSDNGQREMYDYLEETNSYVLEHLSYTEKLSLSQSDEWKKKLEKAYETEQFICAATKLKYYLGKSICDCDKIIIILDDIEPLPYHVQLQFIMQYSRLYECLKNTSKRIEEKEFVINTLIALRPHTYRVLNEYRAFQAFFVNRVIRKKNMVNMGLLFQKKVDYYKDIIPHEVEDVWIAANKVLGILNNKFHSRFANMIKNLAIWDTRVAIKMYEQVLENRVWIQRNIDKTSNFVITEDNYVFNNITVLRALACGHHCIYFSDKSKEIPNVLLNTQDKNYSFLFLALLERFHIDETTDYAYGTNCISYEELLNSFVRAFGKNNDIEADVIFVINYAFKKKILRKGINDTDKPETLDNEASLKPQSQLYISPRGFELMQMMLSDSVYMELCREEYFRDYDDEGISAESSYELLTKGQQVVIFIDLLCMLLELLDYEKKYLTLALENKTLDLYEQIFSDEILCNRLYCGIINSIEYSGNQNNDAIWEKRKIVDNKMEELFQILNNVPHI